MTPWSRVDAGPLGATLEGAVRPGHFGGVCTVVAKFLNTVRPQYAYFGEKDYQQLVIIRRMAADLDLGTSIEGVPTVREPDGLALSSRNVFLSAADREQALGLSRALRAGAERAGDGALAIITAATAALAASPRPRRRLPGTARRRPRGDPRARRRPTARRRARRVHPADRQHRR